MAPKIVSTMRNPVTPRMEEAPGITTSATVPGSVMIFRGRNIPAVLGTSPLMAHRTHTATAPQVKERVELSAPRTWGSVPLKSAVKVSSSMVEYAVR